jgi:hypothetical protein
MLPVECSAVRKFEAMTNYWELIEARAIVEGDLCTKVELIQRRCVCGAVRTCGALGVGAAFWRRHMAGHGSLEM